MHTIQLTDDEYKLIRALLMVGLWNDDGQIEEALADNNDELEYGIDATATTLADKVGLEDER